LEIETLEVALISLLLIISAVGVAIRFLRLPYPIALVITGLALGVLLRGPLPWLRDLELQEVQLTPDVILFLLLPALLFEATLHIEATALRKTLLPIGVLAIPGVLLTTLVVGALVHWGIRLDWSTALLFGAIVAATDPIAVLAIFKRLGAPHGLELLVEGESLFNDGTAVVLARILQGVVLVGTFSLIDGAINFVVVVGGGLVVGLLTGFIVSRLTARIDDHLIEITLTTILTYGTFLASEALHVSGVIAVVTAGLVLGNVGAQQGMSPTTRLALLTFWEYIAFLINSIIFLLIGLQVELASLTDNLLPIAVAIGAVLLARAVVVYGLGLAVLPLPRVLPIRWLHTLFWSGLRGAVSLAVVLALPFNFPNRSLLLDMTFGIVLFTLLVQGLTMEPLLKRLGLVGGDARRRAYSSRRAQALMLRTARRELQRLAADRVLSPRVYTQLDNAYGTASEQLDAELEGLYQNYAALEAEQLRATREHLLRVERSALQRLQRQGLLDNDTAQALAEAVDARLLALQPGTDISLLQVPTMTEFEPIDGPALTVDVVQPPATQQPSSEP
jgi:CPA1 family monovalent cation:H+ antiporter